MIKIKTLLGNHQIENSCLCLSSLQRYCRDDIAFSIHEDGNLSLENQSRLRQLLPRVDFIDRKAADDKIFEVLKKYPHCTSYRKNHLFGLKLFDICLLHEDEVLYYCDSDILFLRAFHFPPPPAPGSAIFMQDIQQPFAVRPWHVKPIGPIRVVSQLNAGFMMVPVGSLDLDYVEYFLGHPQLQSTFGKKPQWIEQTCWASLAARLSTALLDTQQFFMASSPMKPFAPEQVAIHFISTHRNKISDYLDISANGAEDAVQLRAKKVGTASVLDLLYSDIKSRLSK